MPHNPDLRYPFRTVEARGTYRPGLGANPASRDCSGQAPWRSYSGLASPAPRTFPPWRFISMLGLPSPAFRGVAFPVPSRAQEWFRKSLGLAQLDSRCRKLRRQEREEEVEEREEKKGGREGRRERRRRAAAPDGSGLQARALGRTAQVSLLPEAAEGWSE